MKITKKQILLIIISIFIILLYNSNFIMFKVINVLDDKTQGILHLRDIRNNIMKAVDDINPLKGSLWDNANNIPTINIKFKRKDFEKINSTIANAKKSSPYAFYMPNEINQFFKSKITINNKEYKCKIKLHGTNNPNFIFAKKSYTIKISKNNKEFPFNMRRFALIIPSQYNLVGIFTYKIANMLEMLTPKTFLVKVSINGVEQGIYTLEEKLNKVLLERNGLSGYDIVRTDDSWAHQYANNHGTMFSFDYSGLKPKIISKKKLNQIVVYKKILNTNDINFIKQHVNIEKFIKYDVLRYLFGDGRHMTNDDNIKFLYNTATGKLEPYFRIENHIDKIVSNKFTYSPEHYININIYGVNHLLYMLTKDNKYREKRNRALYNVLTKEKEILSIFAQLRQQQLSVLLNDTTNEIPTRYFEYEMNEARRNLKFNFNFLRKYLSYSRVFVEIIKKKQNIYKLTIKPDSNAPIRVKKFYCIVEDKDLNKPFTLIDSKGKKFTGIVKKDKKRGKAIIDFTNILNRYTYSLSLDDNLEPKKNIYNYSLIFDGKILSIKTIFMNDLTKKHILKRDTYVAMVDESKFDFSYINMSIEQFILKHKNLKFVKINNNYILLKTGNYTIKNNIILPYGISLKIEKGTNIRIAPQKSLIVYSNLEINGTKEHPVVISNLIKGKPFGVVGAIGDRNKICFINHLELYGGKDAVINGVYLSGGLSLYNHKKVVVKNSFIHHNSADDGINIKNSIVELKDNIFNANKADQVDLDFCIGYIIKNKFIKHSLMKNFDDVSIPVDDNGDGLDFSGSKMIVLKNYYNGFLDKGISIGEHTKAIIANNRFLNNRSAITVKDESKVYIYHNFYKNNKINLEMYQKKKFFKHPSVYNIDDILNKKIKKTKQAHYYKIEKKIKLGDINMKTFNILKKQNWIEYE